MLDLPILIMTTPHNGLVCGWQEGTDYSGLELRSSFRTSFRTVISSYYAKRASRLLSVDMRLSSSILLVAAFNSLASASVISSQAENRNLQTRADGIPVKDAKWSKIDCIGS